MKFPTTDYQDEGFLDPSDLEMVHALREWMHTQPIPEFSVEPLIEKIYQEPLIFDIDLSASKAEETPIKEMAEQIIKQEIIPAVRMTARRTVDKASEIIKKAKNSVWVTHFSKESLDDDYIHGLLELLRKGIQVTRIVYFHQDQTDNYRWLKRFRKDGRLLPGYRELVYKAMPTPLDLVIVDKSAALIAIPMLPDVLEFFDAVVIDESENHLIRFCRRVFSLLEKNSLRIEEAQRCPWLGVPNYLKVHNLRCISKGDLTG